MKRIIALVIGLIMLVSAACAKEIDLDGMTLEELQELQKEIRKKIDAILADNPSGLFYAGAYTCGKDIKAGAYLVTKGSDELSLIKIWTQDKKGKMDDCILYEWLDETNPYYIEIEDEMILQVIDGPAHLTQWAKPAFAP